MIRKYPRETFVLPEGERIYQDLYREILDHIIFRQSTIGEVLDKIVEGSGFECGYVSEITYGADGKMLISYCRALSWSPKYKVGEGSCVGYTFPVHTDLYHEDPECDAFIIDDPEFMSNHQCPAFTARDYFVVNLRLKGTIIGQLVLGNRTVPFTKGIVECMLDNAKLCALSLHCEGKVTFENIPNKPANESDLMIQERKLTHEREQIYSRISHELRTPIHSIMGYSEMLQAKFLSTQRSLDSIAHASRHLSSVVGDIVNYTSVNSDMIVSMESISIVYLLQSVCDSLKQMAGRANVEIVCCKDIKSKECVAYCDYVRLTQVLYNIINNAVKYNRVGGWVRIGMHREKDEVVLRVMDNGLGISKNHLPHAFDPFERCGKETSDIVGTGLGLSTSKTMMEKMNGSIVIESEENVGTTVTLKLRHSNERPQQLPPLNSSVRDNARQKPSIETGEILYIEDNVMNAELTIELVNEKYPGIHVTHFTTAAESLNYLKTNLNALTGVITDLGLPDANGNEIIRRIRRIYKGKIIVNTANSMVGDPSDEKIHYLGKPWKKVQELYDSIDFLLWKQQ